MDEWILLFIQDYLRFDILTPFFVFLTELGDNGALWLFIIFLLLLIPRTRRIGVLAGISFLVCVGIAEIIKLTAMRPRPFLDIAELTILVNPPESYSFPSIHTVSSFSVAWILLWEGKGNWRLHFFTLAMLMAYSRLYVGVHYPSDVLAGYLIAYGGSFIVWRACGGKPMSLKEVKSYIRKLQNKRRLR